MGYRGGEVFSCMPPPSQPPNLIIGTAGHVDHGKTALVQRLTGINADRLREEQERGMTIDLGFAWFQLPSGAWAGIVDVPGHERFVKNMLAGATGIDLFLLVVAVDEGVMPQTREHITILDVLGVPAGVVVLTKTDLADAEMRELVRHDVAEALHGSVFAGAPMVEVSAKTGAGMDELVACLDQMAAAVRPRDIAGPTRVQLDRSFSLKGFGTVVTGSLVRGRLHVEQELEIAPRGQRVRVRALEVYGQQLDEVAAPCRVGVNLAGVGKDEVGRGDQLIAPGSMTAARMLDVRLRLATDARRPLEYRERVRFHHGTAEIMARVVLLDTEVLLPGQQALAQLRLEGPAVAAVGDRFVIRRYSPPYAIGGGMILDPSPVRHRRREATTLERLRSLEDGSLRERALLWIRSQTRAVGSEELAIGLQLNAAQAQDTLEQLAQDGALISVGGGRVVDVGRAERLLEQVTATLGEYHSRNPLRPAMPTHRLQAAVAAPADLLQWALAELARRGAAVAESGGWRLADHAPHLSEAQERAVAQLRERICRAGMTPPTREEVLSVLAEVGDAHALLDLAMRDGELVLVGPFVMSRAALATGARLLAQAHENQGALAVAQVRDLWGASRKWVVPVLEHFDSTGFTRREGDRRNVLRPPGPTEGVDGPDPG